LGYRGEIMLKFGYLPDTNVYTIGDRIGQLIIIPYPEVIWDEVDELSKTERGAGGFGSTK
jgi:dUTP pyrophosphatase